MHQVELKARTAERSLTLAVACIIIQMILAVVGPGTLLYQAFLMTAVVLSTATLGDEGGRFDIRQPWAVLMVFHLPFWVIGTLNTVIDNGRKSDWMFAEFENMPVALLIVSVGFLCIGVGYRKGLETFTPQARNNTLYLWDCSKLLPVAVYSYIFVWIVRYVLGEKLQDAPFDVLLTQSALPAYARTLSGALPHLLILLVWGAHYSNSGRRDVYFLAVSLTIGGLIWALIIGTSKSLFVLPIFVPIVPYIIFNRAIPVRRIVLSIAVLLLVAYPYTSALRQVYFTSDGPTRSAAREIAFQEGSIWSSLSSALVGDYASQTLSRSSGVSVLSDILELEDRGELDIGGEFYVRSILGLIPRFLWPEKPILLEGVYLSAYLQGWSGSISDIDPAVEAGFISGSVAPTLFGSFYWNLGWLGVVATSLALGYLSGRAYSRLRRVHDLSDPASFIYYVSILGVLDATESEVVKFPSSIVGSIALAWLIIRLLGWTNRPLHYQK